MIGLEKPLAEHNGRLVSMLLLSGHTGHRQSRANSILTHQVPGVLRVNSLRVGV